MCLPQQAMVGAPLGGTPPFLPGPSGTPAADPGMSAPPSVPGVQPTPQPTTVHSKWGNLLRFLHDPLQDAMLGASTAQPTTAIGGGAGLSGFANGFAGVTDFRQKEKAAQVNAQYKAAEEQRAQAQAEEQHAKAQREAEQANAPQAPKVFQFGDKSYLWDEKQHKFTPAEDAEGNPLGGSKTAKKPAPHIIQTGPLAGYDEEGAPATTPMPPSAVASLPSSDVAGMKIPANPDFAPNLSLPSVAQASADATAQRANQKDTKGNWQSEWTRSSPGAAEQLVMVDKNPDSPTFGQKKQISGVTKYDAPDKIASRIDKVQQQQKQVEGLADEAVSAFGENYDQALKAVNTSKVIPTELKSLVRNRIREIAKPGKPPVKENPLNDLINQAVSGVPVPAQ